MSDANGDDSIEEVWPVDETREGSRPCPVCSRKMVVERKGKVTVDLCPEHGVWLDAGELESICKSIRMAAAVSRHKAVCKAHDQEKRRWARYHWWGLFTELPGDQY